MIGCCEEEVRDCCLKSYWVIYFSNYYVVGSYSRCELLGGKRRTLKT